MSEVLKEAMDFTGHEPVLHIEDDGLDVRGYEIDDQFYLDFDWKPGSQWEFLDDEKVFREFVARWLEEMTGEEMTTADIEQLEFLGGSGEDAAADEESDHAGDPEAG